MPEIAPDDLLKLGTPDLEALARIKRWQEQSRENQREPPGTWLMALWLAGRGFGKTRIGAEITWQRAYRHPGTRSAAIAPTHADIDNVLFAGESGILNCCPASLIQSYTKQPSPLITLTNGSQIFGYSAETPDRLRGPQHHFAWGDEVAAWPQLQYTLDMMLMGLRLGQDARAILTSTPRPLVELRELIMRKDVYTIRGSTRDNLKNLAANFAKSILMYEGTRIGRQEIDGELLDDEEGAIFRRSWFPLYPAERQHERLEFVVMSLDTAYTAKTSNHPTACTTWGLIYHNKEHRILLLDAWSEHLEYPELRKKVQKESAQWYGPEAQARKPDVVLVEAKASGLSLIQDLRKGGVNAQEWKVGTLDKIQRAHAVSHLAANKRIMVPESNQKTRVGLPRTWCEPVLEQLCTFSAETLAANQKSRAEVRHHFDYVDSCSQAWAFLRDLDMLRIDPVIIDIDAPILQSTENPYMA